MPEVPRDICPLGQPHLHHCSEYSKSLLLPGCQSSQGTSVLYDSHSCTKTLSITTKSLLLPGCQSSQGTPVLYDSLFYAVALWLTTKPLAGHSWLPVIWGLKGQIWKICRLPTIESIIWKRENCRKALFRIWIKRTYQFSKNCFLSKYWGKPYSKQLLYWNQTICSLSFERRKK